MLKRNNVEFKLSAEQTTKYNKACIYVNLDKDWLKETNISGKSTELSTFRGRDILIPLSVKHVFDDGAIGQLEYSERTEYLNGNVNLPMSRPTHHEGLVGSHVVKIEGNAELNYLLQNTYLCENGSMTDAQRKILSNNGDSSTSILKIFESEQVAENLTNAQTLQIEVMATVQGLNDTQTDLLLSRMKANGGFNLGRIREDMKGVHKRAEINNLVQAGAEAFKELLTDLTGEGRLAIKGAISKGILTFDKKEWVLTTADGKESLAKGKEGTESEAIRLIVGDKLEKVKKSIS